MNRKYYEAYEERYKQIHQENLTWFSNENTPELLSWIDFYNIPITEEVCEIGCGEGRDSIGLAKLGYKVTGMDISKEAITFSENKAKEEQVDVEFICQDFVNLKNIEKKYRYIYSIATLHMLVESNDRHRFLQNLYDLLEKDGKCLLLNLGDGECNYHTNIEEAFYLEKRNHFTHKSVMVASTSFRCVDFDTHQNELKKVGFVIEKQEITSNNEYNKCMTMYLVKK